MNGFQKYSSLQFLKRNFNLLMFFALLLAGSGCEKVIEVELNEANPQIVIEGNLSYNNSRLDVKISRTASYFAAGQPVGVDNVEVTLKDSRNRTQRALPQGEGKYVLRNLRLERETVYQLTVNDGVNEYQAASTLHRPVRIDSLTYQYQPATHFFDSGYRLMFYFTDPAGYDNYYRLKIFQNGQELNNFSELFLFDDFQLDGKSIQVKLRALKLNVGDTIKMQMFSIDKSAWTYLKTFRELGAFHPGSPTPANPISNFSNGALGYFSAWSMTEDQVIIRE